MIFLLVGTVLPAGGSVHDATAERQGYSRKTGQVSLLSLALLPDNQKTQITNKIELWRRELALQNNSFLLVAFVFRLNHSTNCQAGSPFFG